MLSKQVIRQTRNSIGTVPAKKFNQYVYENELKIMRMLLCECSPQYLDWLKNCSQEDLVECLMSELKQDKCSLIFN